MTGSDLSPLQQWVCPLKKLTRIAVCYLCFLRWERCRRIATLVQTGADILVRLRVHEDATPSFYFGFSFDSSSGLVHLVIGCSLFHR